MNNYKILLITILLSLELFSCNKNGDELVDPAVQAPTITGKWISNQFVETQSGSVIINNVFTDHNRYIQFNNDGTGIESALEPITATYTLINFKYSISGSILTRTASNSYFLPDTIKQLTSTSLLLRENNTSYTQCPDGSLRKGPEIIINRYLSR